MRMILLAVFAAFCMLGSVSAVSAGSYVAPQQYVGVPSPSVSQIFAAYPNGGDGLVAAIRELLINDPNLADDVAYVASRGNRAQQEAAAAGMAQAIATLDIRGQTAAMAVIGRAAQLSGNEIIQMIVTAALGGSNAPANLYVGGNPATGANCSPVSPTRPCQ